MDAIDATRHLDHDLRWALPETLRSARLTLRRTTREDAQSLQRLANNEYIHRMLARLPHPYTMEHAHDFIDNLSWTDSEAAYAVLREDAFVGVSGFHFAQNDGRDTIEIGYWFGEPYWGKGYATEAGQTLINALLSLHPQAALVSRAKSENRASRSVLTKLGFVETQTVDNDTCGQHLNVPVTHFIWRGIE